jgi:GT2 family glycosyltransferase
MHKINRPQVSIIVLTFNALSFIKQCLASVKKYSKDYELIVVDNGSDRPTVEWLKKQKGINLILNGINRGFAAGNNQGIKKSSGNYAVLLNSDAVVTKNWIARLIRPIKNDKMIGIVGPFSNHIHGKQKVSVSYSSLEGMHNFAGKFSRAGKTARHISGFCMLIKKEVISKIGLFDENFKIGNYEDVDYCLRAVKRGFKLRIADCFVHHFGSRSFIENINKIDRRIVFYKNLKLLQSKWPNQVVQSVLKE